MILTLVIAKDHVEPENMRMLQEQDIAQDIYVVSAVPIDTKNNIVVDVNQSLPLGVRMGISINKALSQLQLDNYSHILKIDDDVALHDNVVKKLLLMDEPICGVGNCLLMKIPFFLKIHKGRWGECQGEDEYMVILPFVLGLINWFQFKPIEGINYVYKPHSDEEMYANGEFDRSFGFPLLYAVYYTFKCRNMNYFVGWLNSPYKKVWYADLLRRRIYISVVKGIIKWSSL